MRNLKRALSLTLASVMLLGMMVVGAGAAGYPDVDENDNVEAIDVLQAVNVMVGDDNGNFGPDTQVNRAQMAVVMAKLLNLDYDYYRGQDVFWDVPEWAKPYVAACYANGIVSGYDANTYGSGDPVTAVQAASMMMRALGYFKYQSDYAEGFELSTVKQASKIRLFTGINADAKTALTRNQVAQLALNALKTSIVEPSDKTINWVDGNGNVIASGGQVDYVVVASSESYAKAINRTERSGNGLNQVGGCTVELGEQLYNGKLKLTDDIDAFNRPARNWEFDGKNIGLYAKEELMEMENVGTVTGKDLYDLLGKTVINDYTIEVALDGVTDPAIVRAVRNYDTAGGKKNVDFVFDKDDINRSNNGSLGDTGVGVLTQVFVDPDYENGGNKPNGRVWIAIINTYLARANQNYDSKREELALNAYSVAKSSGEFVKDPKNGAAVQLVRLGVDEFPAVKDAKENDPFLVTFAEGEVQSAVPAEVLSEVKVSSFKKSDNVVVDGTTYKFTTTAGFETGTLKTDYTGDDLINLKDRVYNIFLDAYDNLIGVQLVDEVKNYVFISALDLNDSNLVNGTANAKALFLDGTVDTIRVNMDKSDINPYDNTATPGRYNKNSILNTWCTYTKNNSDVYTVKQVADVSANGDDYLPNGSKGGSLAQYHQTAGNTEFKIDKKHITLDGNNSHSGQFARVYGNEKTVYLTAELSNLTNQGGVWGVIKDVDSVTTGVENANLLVWTDQDAADTAGTDKVEIGALNRPANSGDDPDYASKGVYTLYNKDGIVIAAVVVGEDDGTARNLVYAHTGDIDWESYNGEGSTRADGDGLFTWTRKVISDGQEITLTEVSDGNSDLAAMAQYHWYQIKTNGDGEVTGVYRMPGDEKINTKHDKLDVAKLTRLDDLALDYKVDYVEDEKGVTQGEIAYTIQNGANNILYWNRDYIESNLYMDGRTLYVATDDDYGFIVNSNVKWVVQQWDNNAKETYIDEGTTAAGLDNMIKELNRRNTNREGEIEHYHYQVSAIIESGIASSVVIFYNENDYNRPNGGNPEGVEATVDLTGVLGDAKVYDAKNVEIKGVAIRGGNRFTVKTGDTITVVDTDIAEKNFKLEVEPGKNIVSDRNGDDLIVKVLGNAVINGVIGEEKPDGTWTLTLDASVFAKANTKVFTGDGSGNALTISKENNELGTLKSYEYEIPKGAKVTILNTTAIATNSGVLLLEGTDKEDKAVEIEAIKDHTKGTLAFTMKGDLEIGALGTVNIAVYYDADSLTVVGKDATETAKIEKNENGVLYAASGVDLTVTVKDGGKYGIFTNDTDVKVAATSVKSSGSDTGAISANTYLKPVVVVAGARTGVAVKLNDASKTAVAVDDGVIPGTPLSVSVVAGQGTGVIEGDGTKPGADVTSNSYAAKEVTLTPAVKVNLNDGITATVGGEALTAEKCYVKAGSAASTVTATANTGAGTTVLALAGDEKSAAAAYDGATTTTDIDLYMGVEVEFVSAVSGKETTGAVYYQTEIGSVGANVEVVKSAAATGTTGYVKSNTKVFIYGSDGGTKAITISTADSAGIKDLAKVTTTDGKEVYSCTIGVKDVAFAQAAN
ncbi:MAG: hypothetical protein HFF46_06190 [Lawsonibacter sp.]|nr:hypothetical protein [Lawsonibacter sp.]